MIQTVIGSNSPLERIRRRRGVSGAPTSSRRSGARLSARDEELLKEILAEEMDYIDAPEFYEADAEHRIYEEAAEIRKPDVTWYRPLMDDLIPAGGRRESQSRSTNTVLLTAAQEKVIFLQ